MSAAILHLVLAHSVSHIRVLFQMFTALKTGIRFSGSGTFVTNGGFVPIGMRTQNLGTRPVLSREPLIRSMSSTLLLGSRRSNSALPSW